ncbi:MAG: hypothetical protein J0I09_07510 [Sphingobacteriia bacterium]|nr:hypothetical protein [Sphingobacteriia bacterium]
MKELIELLELSQSDFLLHLEQNSKKAFDLVSQLKETKLERFKSLNSYEEQYNFWENEIGINYFKYHFEYSQNHTQIVLAEFELFTDESSWKNLNDWYLREIPKYINKRLKRIDKYQEDLKYRKKLKSAFVEFDELKEKFEHKLSEQKNPKILIQEEAIKIDDWISNQNFLQANYYNQYFENYLKYDMSPDYSKVFPSVHNVLLVNNFYQYARYKEYLEQKLNKTKGTQISVHSDENLTNAQIALLLHYTNVISILEDNGLDKTVISRIISAITNRSQKGLYDPIREVHVNNHKTKDNIEAVIKKLNESKLKDYVLNAEKDLKKAK